MYHNRRKIGLIILLFATQISAQNRVGTITVVPKSVNILNTQKSKSNDIIFVPKKVNLLKPQNPQKIVFGKVEAKKDVLAPSQLQNIGPKNLDKVPKLAENPTFCGIPVPVEMANVAFRLRSELARYLGAKHSVHYYLKRSQRYRGEIEETLIRNALPKELFYLAVAESGLANLTSPKGAKGFWQFMPATARAYNLEVSETVDERLHPQKSTEAACKYLSFLHKMFQDWTLAAAAYNMGEGGVANACKNQGTKSYFELRLNAETAQYVYRIIALKYVLENPTLFGINVPASENYAPIPYDYQPVSENIDNLATFAEDCDTDLATLKAMNPWLISDKLVAMPGKTYHIRIPTAETISAEELIERN